MTAPFEADPARRAPLRPPALARIRRELQAGLAWTGSQPNGERLWAQVRRQAEALLYSAWRDGELAGATPEEAFFVRCDRSTMTQNDLDNGRLNLLVGLALTTPGEFTTVELSSSVRA